MIQIEKNNGIATLKLNRPDKHNAFDDAMIEQMTDAFVDIDGDQSIRLMVLSANGKHFSAGADLAWMKRMANYSYEDNLSDAHGLAAMLNTLNTLSKPSIARVQGAAFGGAVGLVSCCDIAIGSHDSFFCLSEVKIGITPATISPYVLAAIGERAARRYFVSAEVFDATRAQELGLLSEVVNSDMLDDTVDKTSAKILQNSPAAVAASKRLIKDFAGKTIDAELINQSSERIAEIRVSKEGQEGLSAFLDKRPPSWLKITDHNDKEDSGNVQ